MVYGPAGVGKTMFLMGLGLGLATAQPFLTWRAPAQAVPVLYVDGEMSLKELQERLAQLAGPDPPPGLTFLPSELVYERVGHDLTLTAAADRAEIDAMMEAHGIKVLILDNVSTLFPGLDESSKRDWEPIAAWLIRLRHRGLTVLIGHHAGKNGLQRGTSGREVALNTIIALAPPPDHKPEDGCHFFLRFEKSRGIKGAAVMALDARLEEVDGRLVFTAKPLETTRTEQVKAMLAEGIPVKVIAEELQVHLSYVYRMKKHLGL
jgi:putative DNA primase/helicase